MRYGAGLAAIALVAAMAGPTGATATNGSTAAPVVETFDVTRVFSPDGDGVRDRAIVRYSLSRASDVKLIIRYERGGWVRVVHRGAQQAGPHVWRWDGRRGNGDLLGDGTYVIAIVVPNPQGPVTSGSRRVDLDTRFRAHVIPERFGAPRSETPRVYPRSTVVVDALPITAIADERFLESGQLTIWDPAGRAVLRRDVKTGERSNSGWLLDLAWKARRHGRPLPPGRYSAVVTGLDQAGNRGRSKALTIRVSARRLVWYEETRQLSAAETVESPCRLSTANGCGDDFDCGEVVPSELFAGGMSYRSALCPPGLPTAFVAKAQALHLVSAPHAVRGVESARVAFAGSPTHNGELDPGTLTVGGTTTTSASGAQSPWVEDPPLGTGQPRDNYLPPIRPSVLWSFRTVGDDAFDVSTFTVDLRYLVAE